MDAITLEFMAGWNIRAQEKNRGRPHYCTVAIELLEKVKVCLRASVRLRMCWKVAGVSVEQTYSDRCGGMADTVQAAEFKLYKRHQTELAHLVSIPPLPTKKLEKFMCLYPGVLNCLDATCFQGEAPEQCGGIPKGEADEDHDAAAGHLPCYGKENESVRDGVPMWKSRVPLRSTRRKTSSEYLQEGFVRARSKSFTPCAAVTSRVC